MTVAAYSPSLERVRVMAYTVSYSRNALLFAFIEKLQFATPLARLMAPFQSYVWICIAVLLAVSISVILLTRKLSARQRHFIIGGRVNRTPIMNMLNVLIGNVIANPIMNYGTYFGIFARSLFLLWIFFWLVVRNSYQGSMFDYLQNQRGTSLYDTIDKVRLSNVHINVVSTGVSLIPESLNKKRFVIYYHDATTALIKLSSGEMNGVIFTNDIIANYFNFVNKTAHFSMTRDIARLNYPVFFFHQRSILIWMFNRKIEASIESGLITYWTAQYNHIIKTKEKKGPKKLGIMGIMAMLEICAVMYLIAFVVFLMEFFSQQNMRLKNFLDYLTY